jgi:hypothetical protein
MHQKLINTVERVTELMTLALIVIVGVENWNLFRRIHKLEAGLGLRAAPR